MTIPIIWQASEWSVLITAIQNNSTSIIILTQIFTNECFTFLGIRMYLKWWIWINSNKFHIEFWICIEKINVRTNFAQVNLEMKDSAAVISYMLSLKQSVFNSLMICYRFTCSSFYNVQPSFWHYILSFAYMLLLDVSSSKALSLSPASVAQRAERRTRDREEPQIGSKLTRAIWVFP